MPEVIIFSEYPSKHLEDKYTGKRRLIRMLVGKKVPDFKAEAFVKGEIKRISVQDYKGQWVVLCFYPGDFTFV
jgi:peroxiredoxin (alkyl hydroperoxide reductase subunit C)